jgi:hypothetical protein
VVDALTGRIQLAVKCSQKPRDLELFLGIAEKHGFTGLELQQVLEIMQKSPINDRIALLAKLTQNRISRLCYHVPVWFVPMDSTPEKIKLCDIAGASGNIAIRLVTDTIIEATEAGIALGLENPVLVNLHLLGLVTRQEASLEKKLAMLQTGLAVLRTLKTFADSYCETRKFTTNGLPMVRLVRENNPPFHALWSNIFSLIDFHPNEFASSPDAGSNLDLAHYQLYLNYRNNGNDKSPGAEYDRHLYPHPTWETTIEKVSRNIELLHISDAMGYTSEYEGLPIGKGKIRFHEIVPYICDALSMDVMGTLEIDKQHLDPNLLLESITVLKRMFGREFQKYFY